LPRNREETMKGIKLSGNCCVICGWNKVDINGNLLVEGAHVRSFKNQSDLDTYENIIGLCPNHHVEFDRGNIAILPQKKIVIHIDSGDKYHLKKLVGNINHIKTGYFSYHMRHVFKGEGYEDEI